MTASTTKPIFPATFEDIRTVKTRGSVQFVFEVPIERADEALSILGGIPVPGKSRWVAIAPLNHEGEAPAPPRASESGQPSPDKRLVTQSAMACQDTAFIWFLSQEHQLGIDLGIKGEHAEEAFKANCDRATKFVREWCAVQSRSEIIPGTAAGDKWRLLWSDFQAWKIKDAVVPHA